MFDKQKMKDVFMNKNATIVLFYLLVILLVLSSCTSTMKKQSNTKSKSSNNSSAIIKEHDSQDITKLSSLKTPDRILYYYNKQQKIFTKDDPKFQNVIKLNNQRDQGKLEMLQSAMILDNTSRPNNMLVYKYDQSGYASIYFPLNKTSDGKYTVAQAIIPKNAMAQEYGFLSATDQLLDYPNS